MCGKADLAFILNGVQQASAAAAVSSPRSPAEMAQASVVAEPRRLWAPSVVSCDPENRATEKRTTYASNRLSIVDLLSPEPSSESASTVIPKRRKVVNCQVEGCKSRALTRKLCMRHGGGSRCRHPGCNNGAKLRNLCFQHGGSTSCLVPECDNAAKRFGYCWVHGGAYVCSYPSCKKFAAQGGLCWAHGGGNRCSVDGCSKRSYKQYDYRCKEHAATSPAPSSGSQSDSC
ncbi:hypothetical protein P43SY_001831 [Pythium insidiosum]|uniref:WRKY19-like zinc finger domain-containing protein n=1 Tax=Pythium insidiosum TaxID=114742 RepID=A0AAD5LJZ3_PYTIN|nr:hypothetical protein P43SY_001831 [Pythium insidiosum]KAJ0403712.1 hypothetical protein ATCC90586_007523 [Pythium insidiosum]